MATSLRAMTDEELVGFLSTLRDGFIADLIDAGCGAHEAATIAEVQLAAALPGGRPAPGHHMCGVIHGDVEVGAVWFGPDPATADGGWWLFELQIDHAQRGRGLGTRVLALVEAEVRRHGGTTLGLRVFDHNTTARRLYDRAGYRAVATSMRKVL